MDLLCFGFLQCLLFCSGLCFYHVGIALSHVLMAWREKK